MERLFVYGTLRDPNIQQRIIGRVVAGTPDILAGYRMGSIRVGDEIYPIITPDDEQRVNGWVLELTQDELFNTDDYEGAEYQRVRVTLESGIDAWVYTA